VYLAGGRHFGTEGTQPPNPAPATVRHRISLRTGSIGVAVVTLFGADAAAGAFRMEHALGLLGLTALVAPVWYYRHLIRRPEFGPDDRARLRGYLWVLVPSGLFWLMFSQLGSSFVYFAREHTDRRVLGVVVPASWFQSAHPMFLLVVAPLSAWLWLRLGTRASGLAKLAGGLLCSGVGFAVLGGAAATAAGGARVSPVWLLLAFLAQAIGEITFGPVGLSMTGTAAPPGYAGQLMGLYFLGAALGAGLGGQYTRLLPVLPLPLYFAVIAVLGLLAGAALAIRAKQVQPAQPIESTRPIEPASRSPQATVASL
jgi:POT family proton-dependent oligopeptide transporter